MSKAQWTTDRWARYREGWKERFWNRVDKRGADECWEWLGARTSAGYGNVTLPGSGVVVAHRVSWFLINGGISLNAPRDAKRPEFVLHSCDNRACCNPGHLFLGSYADNMKDMYSKGRHVIYRGSKHANSKLSPGAVEEIRRLYASGFTQVQLAGWAKVSQRAISLITRGETYKV